MHLIYLLQIKFGNRPHKNEKTIDIFPDLFGIETFEMCEIHVGYTCKDQYRISHAILNKYK